MFFQFLFLWLVGGKKVRQDLNQTLVWQNEMYRRQSQSNRDFIDAMDEIMNDSTTDLLSHHRAHRKARTLQTTG